MQPLLEKALLVAERTALRADLADAVREAAADFVNGTAEVVEGVARRKRFPLPFHKREPHCSQLCTHAVEV